MDTIYFVNEIAFSDEISPFGAYLIPPLRGFIPKYRKPVLKGEVKEFLKELFEEIAQEYGFEILAMEIMPDHIHLFISAPPKYSPSTIAKILKGVSAKKLFQKFPELRKEYWKNHLWAPSYYVDTAGQVSAEAIRRYKPLRANFAL